MERVQLRRPHLPLLSHKHAECDIAQVVNVHEDNEHETGNLTDINNTITVSRNTREGNVCQRGVNYRIACMHTYNMCTYVYEQLGLLYGNDT